MKYGCVTHPTIALQSLLRGIKCFEDFEVFKSLAETEAIIQKNIIDNFQIFEMIDERLMKGLSIVNPKLIIR